MDILRQPVNAWTLSVDEAVAVGFLPTMQPTLIDGTLAPALPLLYAVLFDDFRAMAVYGEAAGENGKPFVVHIERYTFNDPAAQGPLKPIMLTTPVPEHCKLEYLRMLNPDERTVRLIRNDPATNELTEVLLDLKLHVALERANNGKVNTCIRQFCKTREAQAKHSQTRNILKAIRSVALPEVKMNEVLSLYDAYMNDDVECVITS